MCNNDVNKKFLKSLKRRFVSNNDYRTFFFDLQRLECQFSMTEINRCCRLTKSCSLLKVNTKVLALFFFSSKIRHSSLFMSCSKGLLHNKSSKRIYPVRNQIQTAQDLFGYNHVNYQRHYHWVQSPQLSVSIRTLASNRALHTTHGHKLSYQTSY